ncbi:hypothetical protein [Sphingomonas aerolata]|uniref:hypothetical protein n=1 Tax=Sphingomonas aerolata TaxID=185951 RepID=UPI002FDF9306
MSASAVPGPSSSRRSTPRSTSASSVAAQSIVVSICAASPAIAGGASDDRGVGRADQRATPDWPCGFLCEQRGVERRDGGGEATGVRRDADRDWAGGCCTLR